MRVDDQTIGQSFNLQAHCKQEKKSHTNARFAQTKYELKKRTHWKAQYQLTTYDGPIHSWDRNNQDD